MSRFREGEASGHRALYLENEHLRVTVLPEKGADIFEMIYLPAGIDALMKTPAGLRPPGPGPQPDFLANYEGSWQELFPNTNEPFPFEGHEMPMHGEVALRSWDAEPMQRGAGEVFLRLEVTCRTVPVRLTRDMWLEPDAPVLALEGSLENLSDRTVPFVWGHHVTLGAPFLGDGCRLEAAGRTIITPDEIFETATARLAPGQRESWPLALGRRPGEHVDLREVPGPEAHSHDDAYLTDLDAGRLSVTNLRLGLAFSLEWDHHLFRNVVLWMPYGGADLPPLTGTYGLGIEPWVARGNLAAAIAQGTVARLGPRHTLRTSLRARFGPARDVEDRSCRTTGPAPLRRSKMPGRSPGASKIPVRGKMPGRSPGANMPSRQLDTPAGGETPSPGGQGTP